SYSIFAEENIQNVLLRLSSEHTSLKAAEKEMLSAFYSSRYATSTYPDPMIGIAWSNYPYKKDLKLIEDKTPMTGIEFKISQAIPFPGRLSTQADISETNFKIARLQYAMQRNRLAFDFLSLALEKRKNQKLLNISKDIYTKLKILVEVKKVAYSTGKQGLGPLSRIRWKEALYKDKELKFEGEKKVIKEKLMYFFPGEEIEFGNLNGYIKDLEASILQEGIDLEKASLGIAIARIQLEKGQKEKSLSKFNYYPDFELFASYRKRAYIASDPTPAQDFMSFGFSLRLPVWSAMSNSSNVKAREEHYSSVLLSKEDIVRKETQSYAELKEKLLSSKERFKSFQTLLLPVAKEQLETSRFDYENGKAEFEKFLEAWDLLFSTQLEMALLEEEKGRQILLLAFLSNRILPELTQTKEKTDE
ncbi:MAG: TolC family protein, partial [Leptospiraceae bacterium]|nr:TolC family protein [Leptospiraceae bacterium]